MIDPFAWFTLASVWGLAVISVLAYVVYAP